ncbi:hypothetical protein GcM1_236031 [Golovinomyces cichoracearum]|uniref:Uncharacterized protein n=1 Tax=Golovinomyces cichoracearum TaxID=62708 RepID=A0A420IKI2_9PEZI|nr:hypothetical protein GcM1_236031 [Golovinomyces cichoracearum]
MSENQYSVDELVVKLHLNIDNINQIVHSLSHNSYNQELDQLTAERESAIHSLREKRVEALKEILAQRSREKEETEHKRSRERKLIEEKRVQEWEEILARRRREDEEWQKTIDIEDEIIEKSRSAEDEEREREREEEERVFFEKSEEEIDKLEKNLVKKLEESKTKLKKLDEERKVINAQIEANLSAISVVPNIVFRSRRSRKGAVSIDNSHYELNKNSRVVTPVFAPETSDVLVEPNGPEDFRPTVLRAHSKSLPYIRGPKIGKDFSYVPNHKKSFSEDKISRYTPLLTSSEPKELRLVAIIKKEMTEQAMKKNESIHSQRIMSQNFATQINTRDAGTELSREVLNNSLESSTAILPGKNHASVSKGEPLSKEDQRDLDTESLSKSVHDTEATIPHFGLGSEEDAEKHLSTLLDTKAESKKESDISTLKNIAYDQDESNFKISSQEIEIPDTFLDQREQDNAKIKDSSQYSPVESQEKQLSVEAISNSQDSNQKQSSPVGSYIEDQPLILERKFTIAEKDLAGQSVRLDISTIQEKNSNEETYVIPNTFPLNELQNSSELKSHVLHEKKQVSVSIVSKITKHGPKNQLGEPFLDSTLAYDQSLQLENELTKEELIQANKSSDINQDRISKTNLESEEKPTNDNSDVPSITEVSESDIISEHAHLNQSFQVRDVSDLDQDAQFQIDEEKKKDNGTNLLSESSEVSEIHKEKLDQSFNYSHSTEDLETTNNTEIKSPTQLFREIQRQGSVSQLNKLEQPNLDMISHEQMSIDNEKKELTQNTDQSSEMSFMPNGKTPLGEQFGTKTTDFALDASTNLREDQLSKSSVHDFTVGSEIINSIPDAKTKSSEKCDRNVAVISHEIIPIDTGKHDRFTESKTTSPDVPTQNQIISSIKPIEESNLLDRALSADSTTANSPSGTQIIENKDNFQANLGDKSGSNKILDVNKTVALRTYDMRYRKNISRDLAALNYFNTCLISENNHLSNFQPSTILGMLVSSRGESNMRSSLTTSTKKLIGSNISNEDPELIQEDIAIEHLETQNFYNQDNFDISTEIEIENFRSPSQIYQNSDRSSTKEIFQNDKEMYFDNSSKVESHITTNLEFEKTDEEDEADFLTPQLTLDKKKSDNFENQLHEERSETVIQESNSRIRSLSVEISEVSQDDYQHITMTVEDNNRSSHLESIETRSSSELPSQISSLITKTASEEAYSYLSSKRIDSNIQDSSSNLSSDSKEKSQNGEDLNKYVRNDVNKDQIYNKGPKYDETNDENIPISIDIISESEKHSSKDNTDEEYQIIKYHDNKDEHQSKESDTPDINDKIEHGIPDNIDDENIDNLSEPPIKDDNTKESEQTQERIPLPVSNENRDLEKNPVIGDFISENLSKDIDSEISSDSPRESVNLELELEKDSTQKVHFEDDYLEYQTNISQEIFVNDNKRILSPESRNISEGKEEDSLSFRRSSDSKSTFNGCTDAVSSPVHENNIGMPISPKIPSDIIIEKEQNLELLAKTDSPILPESYATIVAQKNDQHKNVNQINHSSEALRPAIDSHPEIELPSNHSSMFQKARALFEYQQQQQKQQNDQPKKNTIRPLSGLLNRRNVYKNSQNRSMSLSSTFFNMPDVSEEEETSISSIKTSDNNNHSHGHLLHTSSSAPPYSQSNKRSHRAEQSRLSFFEQLQFASGTSPLSPYSRVLSPISCSQGSEY